MHSNIYFVYLYDTVLSYQILIARSAYKGRKLLLQAESLFLSRSRWRFQIGLLGLMRFYMRFRLLSMISSGRFD